MFIAYKAILIRIIRPSFYCFLTNRKIFAIRMYYMS